MTVDLQPAMIVGAVALLVLVLWRRSIPAPPRWLKLTVGLAQVGIVAGIAFTYFGLRDVDRSVTRESPASKATMLASGISHSMWGIVIAGACALVGVIVLAVATWRSRGHGADELPQAKTHDV